MRSHRRVLIVDDNRVSADAMAAILAIEGHQAEAAHDGGHALLAFERLRPDVVLLDVSLPDIDGCRLAEMLGGGKSPPLLIAVSGHDADRIGPLVRASGCARLLVKPVSIEELLAIVADSPARESF